MCASKRSKPCRRAKIVYSLPFDGAQLGRGEYDPVRHVLLWDGRAQEFCDYAEDEPTIEEFLKRMHSYDVARFLAVREAALDPVDSQALRE